MPTGNYWPTGTTSLPYNQWTLSAGSSKWNALLSDDGTTSYIRETTLNEEQNVNIGWPTSPPVAVVNTMTVYARVRLAAAAGWTAGIGIRNASGRSAGNSGGLSETWVLRSHNATASRPGGGSWGPADFDDQVTTFWAIYCASAGASGSLQCTQGYVYLDWNPSGGGFIPIWSIIAGFLGGGIGLEHMPGIAAFIKLVTGREQLVIRPDEYLQALRELREWRQPAFQA